MKRTMTDPATRRAGEARALIAALAIARYAGWSFEHPGAALPVMFSGYLYTETAGLLLVPTSLPLSDAAEVADDAVLAARSDALLVAAEQVAAVATSCEPIATTWRVWLGLGIWSSCAPTRWHLPVTPWLGGNGALWVTSADRAAVTMETAGRAAVCAPIAFALQAGRLSPRTAPYRCPLERRDGEERAAAWLAAMIG